MQLLTSSFGVTIAQVSSLVIVFACSSAEGLHFSDLVQLSSPPHICLSTPGAFTLPKLRKDCVRQNNEVYSASTKINANMVGTDCNNTSTISTAGCSISINGGCFFFFYF